MNMSNILTSDSFFYKFVFLARDGATTPPCICGKFFDAACTYAIKIIEFLKREEMHSYIGERRPK